MSSVVARRRRSDVRGLTSFLTVPLLRDPDRFTFHHRIRRIDDYAFIPIQAGYHFDLVAEIMAEGDRLQRHLLVRPTVATRSPSERKSSVFTGRISEDVGVGSFRCTSAYDPVNS